MAAKTGPRAKRAGAVASVSAHPARGGGSVLRWQSTPASRVIGFDVSRRRSTRPRIKTRLTPRPVAGPANVGAPLRTSRRSRAYQWFDKAGRRGDRLIITAIDMRGRRKTFGPFVVKGKLVRPVSSSRLLRIGTPIKPPPSGPGGGGRGSPDGGDGLAGRDTVRLTVTRDGWTRVALSELADRGLDVRVPANLHLYTAGREVAALVRDGALEFYGEAVDTIDTGERAYVVDTETVPGLRVATAAADPDAPAGPPTFTDTATHADRSLYASALRNGEDSNFFGDVVSSAGTNQVVAVPGAEGDAGTATVTLQGLSTGHHDVNVTIAGAGAGTISSDGQTAASRSFAVAHVGSPALTVRLAAAGSGDVSAVASVRVRYDRALTAAGDVLAFSAPGGRRVRLDGFARGGVRVVDVSDTAHPVEVPTDARGDGVAVTAPGEGMRRLYAFSPDGVLPVAGVDVGLPSSLRSSDHDGTLTIISTPGYAQALAPLVARRRAEGLGVTFVALQDIYDEFSYGQADHHAVTAFLRYARAVWRDPPAYVLLGGDGTFDPRGYLGHGTSANVIPIQPYDTPHGETSSDSLLTGTRATGRLPARTAAQMQAMVAKTLAYQDAAPAKTATFVSDVSDTADFHTASEDVAARLPTDWTISRVDRGADPSARAALLGALDSGPRLVNYIGHGSVDLWRADLLTSADAPTLTNTTRPSFYVMMTCLNAYFIDPAFDSLGEALLKAPGGAAAVFSSTAVTSSAGQSGSNQQLISSLYTSGPTRTGDAVLAALDATFDPDVRNTWTLLGDPTLPTGR